MSSPIGRAFDRLFGDEPSVGDARKIAQMKRANDLKEREVRALEEANRLKALEIARQGEAE